MGRQEDPNVLMKALDDLLIPYWVKAEAGQIHIEDGKKRAVFSFSTKDEYIGFHIEED